LAGGRCRARRGLGRGWSIPSQSSLPGIARTSLELRGGAEVDQRSQTCRVVDAVDHEVLDFQGLPI
jgi:hypothetical protein